MIGRRYGILVMIAALAASTLAGAQKVPKRPKLPRALDSKDWRGYYKCGMDAETTEDASACFYWASRLDAAAAEPYYAAWLVSEAKNDSLLAMALERDPFMHHSRVIVIAEPKYGIFSSPKAKAWTALRSGNYARATTEFTQAIAVDSSLIDEHWGLSIAYYYREKYDSAALILSPLIKLLRARDEKRVQLAYNAVDQIEYMAAFAWKKAGQLDSARAAAQRALSENLARYRAHALLAEIARQARDSATAEQEWMLAGELAPEDLSFRHEYARYLMMTGRFERAEQELRRILTLDPEYVTVNYDLAISIDRQGDARKADALAQYEKYLAMAPASLAGQISRATARVETLRK